MKKFNESFKNGALNFDGKYEMTEKRNENKPVPPFPSIFPVVARKIRIQGLFESLCIHTFEEQESLHYPERIL